jgi:hypothetical protein
MLKLRGLMKPKVGSITCRSVFVFDGALLRDVLEKTTIANVASGHLPRNVQRLSADPEAWIPH